MTSSGTADLVSTREPLSSGFDWYSCRGAVHELSRLSGPVLKDSFALNVTLQSQYTELNLVHFNISYARKSIGPLCNKCTDNYRARAVALDTLDTHPSVTPQIPCKFKLVRSSSNQVRHLAKHVICLCIQHTLKVCQA
jgi:hypothetical protein